MKDLLDLTGKVAIGNGGIGRAIALGLAHHGADIVVAARNEQKTRPWSAKSCKELHGWRSTTRATH